MAKHKFTELTVRLDGTCITCAHSIFLRTRLTEDDIERINNPEGSMYDFSDLEAKIKNLYQDIGEHECSGST